MTRIRQLLKEPTYRTKVAFFLILGFAIVLLSILIPSSTLSDLLKEFAVVFLAVGVLQLVWDFLGGDPLESRIEEVRDEVASLERIMNLPSDLMEHKIGIQRIWPNREIWQESHSEGLKVWRERVCEADRVNIMSNTLWNNWMRNGAFREKLFERIKDGALVRILIYDPDSEAVGLRARIEKDVLIERESKLFEMQSEIRSTLFRMAQGWSGLPASDKENLEVRLTTWALHPVQIIQADKLMLLTLYLSGKSGTPSPTMQLVSGSAYFEKYAEQFEIMWEWGTPLDDERFRRILQGD